MATTTIKSTYSLDVETVRQLEAMARRWRVSKSEALRRAIRAAADQQPAVGRETLEALDRLQDSLTLTPDAAKRWERSAKNEGFWPENPSVRSGLMRSSATPSGSTIDSV